MSEQQQPKQVNPAQVLIEAGRIARTGSQNISDLISIVDTLAQLAESQAARIAELEASQPKADPKKKTGDKPTP